jgi:spore coat protein U-like protein
MKKTLMIAVVMLITLIVATGAFAASIAPAPTVTVNGTVSAVCTLFTSGTTLNFTIDPSFAGPISATQTGSNTAVKCTNGHAFTVTAASLFGGSGDCTLGITGTLKDAGANTIPYTFTCANGTGTGFGGGQEKNLAIAASVTALQYQAAVVSATYTDTVTLTISY